MISYWRARIQFEVQLQWLILTGRGHAQAPDSLLNAYNRQARLWNKRQQ